MKWRVPGRGLRKDESGVSLVETLIVAPVVLLFSVGLIEFGTFLTAKSRVEAGVRDAARYLGRCTQQNGCSATAAKNLAVFGNIAGTSPGRVEGWSVSDISVETWDGTTWTANAMAGGTWPDRGDKVRVSTDFNYTGYFLQGALGFDSGVPIRTFHEDVYYGQ